MGLGSRGVDKEVLTTWSYPRSVVNVEASGGDRAVTKGGLLVFATCFPRFRRSTIAGYKWVRFLNPAATLVPSRPWRARCARDRLNY